MYVCRAGLLLWEISLIQLGIFWKQKDIKKQQSITKILSHLSQGERQLGELLGLILICTHVVTWMWVVLKQNKLILLSWFWVVNFSFNFLLCFLLNSCLYFHGISSWPLSSNIDSVFILSQEAEIKHKYACIIKISLWESTNVIAHELFSDLVIWIRIVS